MNPLNYSLSQVLKLVTSVIFVGGAVAALIFNKFDPNFTQAVVALAGAVVAAIGVFAAKNATEDDYSKAVAQLQGAAVFVVGFFTTVPTSTVEKVTILVGALLSVFFVARAPGPDS